VNKDMNNKIRLQKLKELQVPEEKQKEKFGKHDNLLTWINSVAPLLKYDDEHYNLFMDAALKVSIPKISSYTAIPCLNIMRGVVDRAVNELENNIERPAPKNEMRDKSQTFDNVTDILFNSSYKIRLLLLGALLTSFALGVGLGSSKLYKEKIMPFITLYNEKDNTPPNTQMNIPAETTNATNPSANEKNETFAK
jgi:hypothetical protein